MIEAEPETGASDEPAVEVRQSVLDQLVAHAREEAPNECCGMLVGTPRRIERAIRARNTLSSPTRYQIDPGDQLAAIHGARERGEAVVGFYHSHPGSSPTPSSTDRAEAAYPGHCYLIVFPGTPLAPPEVRGYRLQDSGNFRAVTLVPVP